MIEIIPQNWCIATLEQVANWGSGGTPSRGVPEYFIGDIPWIKTGELGSKFVCSSEEKISELAVKKSSAKIFPKGSVGIAMYGATIGKLSIFGIDASTNQACAVAQCYDTAIDNEFLYYFLMSEKRALIKEAKGGAQPNISQGLLKQWSIKLPPRNEQTRIIEKIEELFSELDKGIESFKTAKAQLAVYRQALLKHAFEGKLTEQWRKDNAGLLESPEQLLSRIQQEREERYQQKIDDWQAEVEQWEANGKEGKKPSKPKLRKNSSVVAGGGSCFGSAELGGIAEELILGKMLDKVKNKGIERPYLGNINVRWGRFNLNSLKMMRIEDDERKRFSLVIGDLVICEGGEPGRCAIWEGGDDVYIQKALHRARFTESYHPKFAYYHMLLANANGTLSAEFTGTTIKHLTGKGLEKVKFPLAPYSEQVEIVNRLESQFSAIDKVEDEVTCNLLKSEILRQSILKKAFSGQLVAQDPSDEPAVESLKKIAIEKTELAVKEVSEKSAAKKAKAEAKKT